MPLTYEESSSRSTKVMYIRGIPFECPDGAKKDEVAPTEAPARRRRPETCANRLLARRLAGDETAAGLTRVEARVHAGLMESRRAVRLFTGQGVPLRVLRRIVLAACGPTFGRSKSLAGFVLVESGAVMEHIADMVTDWLRREGLGQDGPGAAADARRTLFGGAPHLIVVHGAASGGRAAEACAKAVARLEWCAAGAGLGTCFAGELVQAATDDTAVAAALSVPHAHVVYAAMLVGFPEVPVLPERLPDTTLIWL